MTDESTARRLTIGNVAPWAVLGVGLAAQLAVAFRWIGLERRVGEPVVCEALFPVNDLVRLAHGGQLLEGLARLPDFGLLGWLGMGGARLFGSSGDTLLVIMLLCMLAGQLLTLDIGRRLGGLWVGVLAALLLPLFPDVALVGRRWGPILPQLLILLALADLLLCSRGLSRPLLALGCGLLAMLGAVVSPFATHDMLFLAAAGSMVGGAVLRGLALGRGALDGERAGRGWVLLGAAMVALPAGLLVWRLGPQYVSADYYAAEVQGGAYAGAGQVFHPWYLTAYLRLLFHSSAGPWLTVATALGLAGFLWKGRGRAELTCWLVGPLLALSLLSKKNWYYVAYVFPVLPLLLALGLGAVPWRRLRWAVGAVVLVVAGWGWGQASFRQDSPALYRWPQKDPAFQSNPGPPLEPARHFRYSRHQVLLDGVLPGSSCPGGAVLGLLPTGSADDLIFVLADRDPCLRLESWEPDRRFDWLLFQDNQCAWDPQAEADFEVDPDLRRPSFVASCERRGACRVAGVDTHESPCLWVLEMGSGS